VAQLDLFLPAGNAANRHVDTAANDVVTLQVSSGRIDATYRQIDGAEATPFYYERPARLLFKLRPKLVVAR
jgi:hypothetical protein